MSWPPYLLKECGVTESGLLPAHTYNPLAKLKGERMSKKNKIQMPQSTAGLVRYYDESKERIKFKPEHVAIAAGVIIVIEILLKLGFF
jgi:preprotein translocase subunit Sec61beta